MADNGLKRMQLPGRLQIYDSGKSKESMHCLICDGDIATHNGYNILYEVLPNGGSLLCDNINRVLRRDLDAVTARSTVLCNRCFSLFVELDVAENQCNDIKKEIESYYLKTCEIYNDELPISVKGIACQTDIEELDPTGDRQSDLKLKIALVSKRKRGRPIKAQQKKGSEQDSVEFADNGDAERKKKEKFLKKEDNIEDVEDIALEVRRTRSNTKNGNRKKTPESDKDRQIKKEEIDEKEMEKVSETEEIVIEENGLKIEETKTEEGEFFNQDYYNNDNDDDDFEWKEEPLVEIHDDSPDSEAQNVEESFAGHFEPNLNAYDSQYTNIVEIKEEPSIKTEDSFEHNINLEDMSTDDTVSVVNHSQEGVMMVVKPRVKKIKRKKRSVLCPYCYRIIGSHFARHLMRNHGTEELVKKFESYAKNHPERKQLIVSVRKQGYFLMVQDNKGFHPVKKPSKIDVDADEYLPCAYCLGYYNKKYLPRHFKTCCNRPAEKKGRSSGKIEAQNILSGLHVGEFSANSGLKDKVFKSMRPDDISLVAKTDPLICLYGEFCLEKHRGKQNVNTAISNKVREMARLLMVLRETDRIKRLDEILKPEKFYSLVAAVKKLSGFDERTRSYKKLPLTQRMGANLKVLCDVAHKAVYERTQLFPHNGSETCAEIEALTDLIWYRWGDEIGRLDSVVNGRRMTNAVSISCAPTNERDEQKHEDVGEKDLATMDRSIIEATEEVSLISEKVPVARKYSTKMIFGGNRVRWKEEEKDLVRSEFARHIRLKIAPKKKECEDFLKKHLDVFVNKDWLKIKTFVYNEYRDK